MTGRAFERQITDRTTRNLVEMRRLWEGRGRSVGRDLQENGLFWYDCGFRVRSWSVFANPHRYEDTIDIVQVEEFLLFWSGFWFGCSSAGMLTLT
ncbi:hypothetical protein Zmor_004845 [Zophobas morio]|uniref:Uncharacterized protein n=1 Tax=Zophobas morio TaxID=2755281 RepID=A0AA38MJY0_9CUCU|nr:hypothetical protein Zmor_004845 [Zophobas morio]